MADYGEEQFALGERGTRVVSESKTRDVRMEDRNPNTIGYQITAIQEQLQRQDEFLSMLEKVLAPLLAPDEDNEANPGPTSVRPPMSDIAEQLESYNDRISRHNRRLIKLRDRINL